MRILLSSTQCIEVSRLTVLRHTPPRNKRRWTVSVWCETPDFFWYRERGDKFYKKYGESREWGFALGKMSHKMFASQDEAYAAAIKLVDIAYETGCLDLRNRLEDWGLLPV